MSGPDSLRETAKSIILQKYDTISCIGSDINEHLPTLRLYAQECNHVTECGVRGVVSSWAFAAGLLNKPTAKLIQIDLDNNENVVQFGQVSTAAGISTVFYHQSDLECPQEPTELLFIDTWHVYGQLKRELARWRTFVSKYIILHDTTVDEWHGETVRRKNEWGWDAAKQSLDTGIPMDEINKGLWPAVQEFVEQHPEWRIKQRFTHNNGLTVLSRLNI